MPSIPLYPRPASNANNTNTNLDNPVPHLLQTPSGLAILELQGTINIPSTLTTTTTQIPDEDTNLEAADNNDKDSNGFSQFPATFETPIGKVVFPEYSHRNKNIDNSDDKKWMKRVYLYVGRFQRMAGEVKELANPLAVIRKRTGAEARTSKGEGEEEEGESTMDADGSYPEDELEIVEIVKYKLLFTNRPEPANDN